MMEPSHNVCSFSGYNFVLLYGFFLVMPNMVCIKLKVPRLATAIPMYIVT